MKYYIPRLAHQSTCARAAQCPTWASAATSDCSSVVSQVQLNAASLATASDAQARSFPALRLACRTLRAAHNQRACCKFTLRAGRMKHGALGCCCIVVTACMHHHVALADDAAAWHAVCCVLVQIKTAMGNVQPSATCCTSMVTLLKNGCRCNADVVELAKGMSLTAAGLHGGARYGIIIPLMSIRLKPQIPWKGTLHFPQSW